MTQEAHEKAEEDQVVEGAGHVVVETVLVAEEEPADTTKISTGTQRFSKEKPMT